MESISLLIKLIALFVLLSAASSPIVAKRTSYPNNAVTDCASGDTQICSSVAQDCISHCYCIPVGLIIGICVKIGGSMQTSPHCFSHADCIHGQKNKSSSLCIRVEGSAQGFCS